MEVFHRERVISLVAIKLNAAGAQRVKLAKDGKCLGCECDVAEKTVTRGLCDACYQAARRAIAKGKATNISLVRNGLMLECAPVKGRPLSNPLAKLAEGA